MLMTDEEVEARLSSPNNLCKVIMKNNGGKSEGATNIPSSVRDLIAITGGKQTDIAKEFEVDHSSVSEIKKGMVGGKLDKDLAEVGKKAKRDKQDKEDRAHEDALDCLMTSLGALQPKLADPDLKAKDLSKIASDMSKVVSAIRGEKGPSLTSNVQVILTTAPQKKINSYEVIEAN